MIDEKKFLELYDRQKESGLTVNEFCSNEVIAPSTFYYWQKKLRKSKRLPGFIPIMVKPATYPAQSGHARNPDNHPMYTNNNSDVCLEFVYPNGTILRIKQDLGLTQLRNLVHLYD